MGLLGILLALAVLLVSAGKDPQAARMVEVPFPDMEAALASGGKDSQAKEEASAKAEARAKLDELLKRLP